MHHFWTLLNLLKHAGIGLIIGLLWITFLKVFGESLTEAITQQMPNTGSYFNSVLKFSSSQLGGYIVMGIIAIFSYTSEKYGAFKPKKMLSDALGWISSVSGSAQKKVQNKGKK